MSGAIGTLAPIRAQLRVTMIPEGGDLVGIQRRRIPNLDAEVRRCHASAFELADTSPRLSSPLVRPQLAFA